MLIFFTIATSLVILLFVTSITVTSKKMLLLFWTRHTYFSYIFVWEICRYQLKKWTFLYNKKKIFNINPISLLLIQFSHYQSFLLLISPLSIYLSFIINLTPLSRYWSILSLSLSIHFLSIINSSPSRYQSTPSSHYQFTPSFTINLSLLSIQSLSPISSHKLPYLWYQSDNVCYWYIIINSLLVHVQTDNIYLSIS
jgi:hypothetical protein